MGGWEGLFLYLPAHFVVGDVRLVLHSHERDGGVDLGRKRNLCWGGWVGGWVGRVVERLPSFSLSLDSTQ